MQRFRVNPFACLALLTLACSGEDRTTIDTPGLGSGAAALRDLSAAEAAEDLEQIFTLVESEYGPYEYKEARFGYSIAELEDRARAKLRGAAGDDNFYAVAHWFLTRLDDGHVSLQGARNANPVISYYIGAILQPVEGKALVAEIFDPSLAEFGITYGDEVVSVDGVSPFALLEEFEKLNTLANPISNQHLIFSALIRPGYASRIRPTSPTAHLELRHADGTEYSRDLVWRESRDVRANLVSAQSMLPALQNDSFLARGALEINAYARGSIASLGATLPFFLTPETTTEFDITRVTPNLETLARYGLDPATLPDIYAGLFAYAGKTFLLVRQSGYSVVDVADLTNRLQYYRAVMDQYDNFVDGLVIDQTHNPGGNLAYCLEFARLLTTTPGQNFVQAYNADRRWIDAFRTFARAIDPTLSSQASLKYELLADRVEAAYDAGRGTSEPLPLLLTDELPPDDTYVWKKPRLVLVDELAGSCGDVYPMLVKRNQLAPLFGRRTMGLGGNVEAFGPLTNSQATLFLTRGIFTTHQDDETYAPSDFVENNGISPDIEHVITVNDFRAGFVDYMTHFSQALSSQLDGAVGE